jgi:uncharacterized membrane protein YfcA
MTAMVLGIAVGLLLGLTGAGGSVVAVPLLMAALHWPMTQAAPVALLAVAASAAIGALIAWRHSYVRYRAAMVMAIAGAATSPLGILAADRMREPLLEALFALTLIVIAIRMFRMTLISASDASVVRARVAGEGQPSQGKRCRIDPSTGRLIWTWPTVGTIGGIGTAAGFLSGLLGVGGGFVIVPALRSTTSLSMHSAVATSLMAISLTSCATVVNSMLLGRQIPIAMALPFVSGSIAGMVAGRLVAPYVAGVRLQQAFALMAAAIAILMVMHAI